MRPGVSLTILIILASIGLGVTASSQAIVYSHDAQGGLKKFGSYEEMESFLRTNLRKESTYYSRGFLDGLLGQGVYASAPSLSSSLPRHTGYGGSDFSYTIGGDAPYSKINDTETAQVDYSTTNVQIKGVDEADIIKNDGRYLYVVAKSNVFIVDAYPASQAKILSRIEKDTPIELFVRGDKLVILGDSFVRIYNISNKSFPVLTKNISFNGHYFASRMIGDFVYVVSITGKIDFSYPDDSYWNYGPSTIFSEKVKVVQDVSSLNITLPKITIDSEVRTIQANEIKYFDVIDSSYCFTTVMAIDTAGENEEVTSETYVTGLARDLFVSSNNIYITFGANEKTIVHKFVMDGTKIEYKGSGEFPGHILNQFSMDEYNGYFRVATTSTKNWEQSNNVYVLDENLSVVGKLEGIAPWETIYSARFMGERAYLVTFRLTDPFFVIDLKDPQNPKVLGELEIPGFSNYLHPYDENNIIGIGKDDGVKIALFDVSNPEKPNEISKYDVGFSGTDSYALQDHKAFLFSRSKNLLVIPVSVSKGESSWRYTYYDQEAHIFKVSLEEGIVFRGKITHYDNISQNTYSWDYSSYPDYSVKRSLYIENVLHTISSGLVKMNDLVDLREINKLVLQ